MKSAASGFLALGVLAASFAAGEEAGTPVGLSAASYAGGVLQPNEDRAERTLMVDAARALTLVVTSTADLKVSLLLPDGSVASPDRPDDRLRFLPFVGREGAQPLTLPGAGSGFNTLIVMNGPAAGKYVVRLAKAPATEPVPFLITLTQDSDLRLGLVTPFRDVVRGGAFVVAALLVDGNTPVRDARVLATLTRAADDPALPPIAAGELTLTDDGKGADTREADGVYSGIFAAAVPGTHWIAVRATGTGTAGKPFARNAGTSFRASEPTVEIAKMGPGAWVPVKGGVRMARLAVPLQLTGRAGAYEVVVTLRAKNGRSAGGNGFVEIPSGGRARVTVNVEAAAVRLLDANGPYILESAEVFGLDKDTQERVLRARRLGVDKTPPIKLTALDVP